MGNDKALHGCRLGTQVRRCTRLCYAGSECGQQIQRTLKFLVPLTSPPSTTTNIHNHIITAKVFGNLSQSLPETSLDTCITNLISNVLSHDGKEPQTRQCPPGVLLSSSASVLEGQDETQRY